MRIERKLCNYDNIALLTCELKRTSVSCKRRKVIPLDDHKKLLYSSTSLYNTGKHFIYKSKCQLKEVSVIHFLDLLKLHCRQSSIVEKRTAIKNRSTAGKVTRISEFLTAANNGKDKMDCNSPGFFL